MPPRALSGRIMPTVMMSIFIHALLMVMAWRSYATPVQILAAAEQTVQVTLLDPAPMSAEAPPDPPPTPVPPLPRPVPKPQVKPQVEPAPEPVVDTPVAEPVAVAAEAFAPAEASSAASGSDTATGENKAAASQAFVAADINAAYLRNPRPPYPPMSRRLREEGKVDLRVHVLANGNAGQVEVERSSGFPRLDESAATAVRRWKFSPRRRGGETIDSWETFTISFKLEESVHERRRRRNH
ncbi:MAG: TonB family protein [Zoogloeaceae bacterium]|nr:TonB family protein [Zoogloeaceae bacterium]